MHATGSADQDAAVLRFETGRRRRRASPRRTEYLAHAYACHDMALSAEDAGEQRALRAMTMLWQALAQRASVRQS